MTCQTEVYIQNYPGRGQIEKREERVLKIFIAPPSRHAAHYPVLHTVYCTRLGFSDSLH